MILKDPSIYFILKKELHFHNSEKFVYINECEMDSQNEHISYIKMTMIENYFSNTVLNILHNETRRIKFQTYKQNWRENSDILTGQIQKCKSEAEIYFPNMWK
jgi:hypothetical protein